MDVNLIHWQGPSVQFLCRYHSCINAAHSYELVVSALLHNSASVKDEYTICMLYTGQPVSDHDRRATLGGGCDCSSNLSFGIGIKLGCCFVEE